MSARSPKNKYIACVTFKTYVEGIGQSVTFGGQSIEEVKAMANDYKKFCPHVIVKENLSDYPKFNWIVVEEYNI